MPRTAGWRYAYIDMTAGVSQIADDVAASHYIVAALGHTFGHDPDRAKKQGSNGFRAEAQAGFTIVRRDGAGDR